MHKPADNHAMFQEQADTQVVDNWDNQEATSSGLLRIQAVCNMVGLGKTTIWNKLNRQSPYFDASFPQPIRIGKRAVAWDRHEIRAWIAARKEEIR